MFKTLAILIACTAMSLSGCANGSDSAEVARATESGCTDPIRCPGTEMVTPHHVDKAPPVQSQIDANRAPNFADTVDFDNDGDPASRDCDDHDAHRRHGLVDIACDGIDQNCDGHDDCDVNGVAASPAPRPSNESSTAPRMHRTL